MEADDAPTLPPPGQIFQRDFRAAAARAALPTPPPTHPGARVRLVQWNLERGYQLPGIIEALRRLDADVIALQEVDVGCDRSGGADVGEEIASALSMHLTFLPEFEELRSARRAPRDQGGGVHGNALLSKFDVLEAAVVEHSRHPLDWNDPNGVLQRREPRRGRRAALRALLAAPGGPLVVYSAHFEVFCGAAARVEQLADLFDDARRQRDAGRCRQAILGDLNTMAHGIARFSPKYCRDRMRFLGLGRTEGELWERAVLAVPDLQYQPETDADLRAVREDAGGAAAPAAASLPAPRGPALRCWGLSAAAVAAAANPGFACPFPAVSTVTLDNPRYRLLGRSLMRGKLDWALLRRLRVLGTALGNLDYALSDHRLLVADVALED